MTFEEVLNEAAAMLERQGQVSYRALIRQFNLDDVYLEDLKEALLYTHADKVSDDGRGLIWTPRAAGDSPQLPPSSTEPSDQLLLSAIDTTTSLQPDAERRQLTVMFCDLVDSTTLSGELDPEDLRHVVRAYQTVCTEVIQQFDGHVAQLLGDGLLVYFGYPTAHEDDAQRAVRSGLGMLAAMTRLNTRLEGEKGVRLAIRVGIHTGLVVIGEMGGAGRQEQLALGETPNLAARLQGLAVSDTLVVSVATQRLIEGYFESQSLGEHALKGVAAPIAVYRIVQESGAQNRLDMAGATLTPLVGREQETRLLGERWQLAQEGQGQVVLISGEAGIGKSRLLQVLKGQIAECPVMGLECRSSPYYQNTALYPMVELMQRLMGWQPNERSDEKVKNLEQGLSQYRLALEEAVPLIAALVALPLPQERYEPLLLSPQELRQKTLETLLAMVVELAEREPVLFILEDLHWTDPTTLEFLGLIIDHIPTTRLLMLLTCRPEFQPEWDNRSYIVQMPLRNLSQGQVADMAERVTGGKALPEEVVHQIVEKTDGVPLVVEELTKAVLEAGFLRETSDRYELTGPLPLLGIPATLHDSLMARLDRLGSAKSVAQLGAVIGRQFAYELLQAVSQVDQATLQQELQRLVGAELLYQRGLPPQSTYLFKHALIQDAAYESLLRQTRQQVHWHVAQALERHFPDTVASEPELVAHHYTQAGQYEAAVTHWCAAGQQAYDRSAYPESRSHLEQGLALLSNLPDDDGRAQLELRMLKILGLVYVPLSGNASAEVERANRRAYELCQQLGDIPGLLSVSDGLWRYYITKFELGPAREFAQQYFQLAQKHGDVIDRIGGGVRMGATAFFCGELVMARSQLEQGIMLETAHPDVLKEIRYGHDPGAICRVWLAVTLWCLGYAEQAVQRIDEALDMTSHPLNVVSVLAFSAWVALFRGEADVAQSQADRVVPLCETHGFVFWKAFGQFLHGYALAMQGDTEAGLLQMRQAYEARLSTGAGRTPHILVPLAEFSSQMGQFDAAFANIADASELIVINDQGYFVEAEVHRIKGELLLMQTNATVSGFEAEACFQQALAVARRQEAKSLELRAATSLARLWQQQDQPLEAHNLLAAIYNWFTEGFDTADLKTAKALLDDLSASTLDQNAQVERPT